MSPRLNQCLADCLSILWDHSPAIRKLWGMRKLSDLGILLPFTSVVFVALGFEFFVMCEFVFIFVFVIIIIITVMVIVVITLFSSIFVFIMLAMMLLAGPCSLIWVCVRFRSSIFICGYCWFHVDIQHLVYGIQLSDTSKQRMT